MTRATVKPHFTQECALHDRARQEGHQGKNPIHAPFPTRVPGPLLPRGDAFF